MPKSYHTRQLSRTYDKIQRDHARHVNKALAQIKNILAAKGSDYNNLGPMAEQFPFGDRSWSTMLWIKSRRLASIIHADRPTNFEGINDTALDLAAYAVAYLAWRNMMEEDSRNGNTHSSNSTDGFHAQPEVPEAGSIHGSGSSGTSGS